MPFPVSVYSSDDAGAPQIAASGITPSQVIDILKKCLVEGYGTKSPLGWSLELEDTANHKIIFRNDAANGGSGGVVKFWSYNGSDAAYTAIWLQTGQGFVSMDELVSPDYVKGFGFNNSSSHRTDSWTLIGTSKGFYFFLDKKGVNIARWAGVYSVGCYCGDYIPSVPNDVSTMISFSNFQTANLTSATTSPSWQHTLDYFKGGAQIVDTSPTKFFRLQDTDGAEHFAEYGLSTFFKAGSTTVGAGIEPLNSELYCPTVVTHHKLNGMLPSHQDRASMNIMASQFEPAIRGILPGWINTIYPRFADKKIPFVRTINNQQHWTVPTGVASASSFINMEVWE